MSLRELARRSHYHISHLSNVLNERKRLTAQMAADLDSTLGASGKLIVLAPVAPAPADPAVHTLLPDSPDRRSVLAGTVLAGRALAGWLAPIDTERLARAVLHPPRVDMPVVRSLGEMLVAQRHIENSMGTVAVRGPVLAQLATIEELMCQARGPVRPALVSVAQQWAHFAAYLLREAGDPAGDRARLAQALEWAVETGDKTMIATVLARRAQMALRAGEVGTAVGLAQAAQQDKKVAIGTRVDAAHEEARGHVLAGDTAAAGRKLGEAAELAAQVEDDTELHPWLFWITPQMCLCVRGEISGLMADKPRHLERAITELETGYAALPDDQKSSAWATRQLAYLADVHARAGDLGQSCGVALQATAIAQRTGSVRLAETLTQVLARLAARWPHDPRVVELDEALRWAPPAAAASSGRAIQPS